MSAKVDATASRVQTAVTMKVMHPKYATFLCLCVAHPLVVKVKYNFPGSGKEYGLSDESFGEGGQLYGAGKDHRGVKVLAHFPICSKIFSEPFPR